MIHKEKRKMANFLIEIEYDSVSGAYMACYSDGQNVLLAANTYEDAVLEADLLNDEVDNYELGYN
jgi:predicted RNase H-like HicB family nuclease